MSLPLLQMAVAAALLLLGYARDRAATGFEPPPVAPETLLCYAINAPVLLFRMCYIHLLGMMERAINAFDEPIVDDALFVIGAGLLWYMVGCLIDFRGQKRACLAFLSMRFRMVLDLFLVLFGIALGVVGFGARRYQYGVALVTLYILWSLAIIVLYGLDFLRLVRRKESDAP